MTWLVVLLWLLMGIALGAGFIFYGCTLILKQPHSRLYFFKVLARYWSSDLESALRHVQVLKLDDVEQFDAIQFETCAYCHLPWPIQKNGKFGLHPRFDERLSKDSCPGSNTNEFVNFE